MTDFRTLPLDKLVEALCNHVGDFEDEATTKNLNQEWILEEVSQGKVVMEAEEHAIAAMRPEGWRIVDGNSVMWLLYVARDVRGRGVGKAFVQRLRAKYEHQLPMVLICNGSTREAYFQSCGFRIKERMDGKAVMLSELNRT